MQYTLLSILFFSVAHLIRLGVYPDPQMEPEASYAHPPYKSNVGLDWGEVKEDYEFKITV